MCSGIMGGQFIERGGLWVVCQGFLLSAVIALGLIWGGQWRSEVVIVSGVILLLIGAIVGIAGFVALGRNLTPFPKPSANTRLVQNGIYRLMRHPLYTAVICGSVGWALFRESPSALAAALALVPFFHAKARREERWLRQHFPDYARYEQRVRRFIPWIY